MHVKPPLPSRTRKSAQDLRCRSTDAEHKLWYQLRGGRLSGLKFRRQHPIPPYVVDFYCHEFGLIVELDGSQHNPHVDAARSRALKRWGLDILRFWDNQVLQEMDSVLEAICKATQARTLTRPFGERFALGLRPPPPEGRGKKQWISLRKGEGP